jgi:hypothetical protein
MVEMRSVIPDRLSAVEVNERVGHYWTCPWCKAESTHANESEYRGWAHTALRRFEPRFICLGCCDEVYSTCAAENFETHPFQDLVAEVAAQEGCDVTTFRRLCILEQLEIISVRSESGERAKYERRKQHLTRILAQLESAE